MEALYSVRFMDHVRGIGAEHLTGGFFEGWPNPPNPETHLAILSASDHVEIAIDVAAGKVVGFVTALTDGVLSAYLPLVEVLPPYRGRGIASELVRRMLGKLDGLYMVDVICDPELESFYTRFGLAPATGMIRRNYAAQSGVRPTSAR